VENVKENVVKPRRGRGVEKRIKTGGKGEKKGQHFRRRVGCK